MVKNGVGRVGELGLGVLRGYLGRGWDIGEIRYGISMEAFFPYNPD